MQTKSQSIWFKQNKVSTNDVNHANYYNTRENRTSAGNKIALKQGNETIDIYVLRLDSAS